MAAEIFDFKSGKRLTPKEVGKLSASEGVRMPEMLAEKLVRELERSKKWNEREPYYEQALMDMRARSIERLATDLTRPRGIADAWIKSFPLDAYLTAMVYLEKLHQARAGKNIAASDDPDDSA